MGTQLAPAEQTWLEARANKDYVKDFNIERREKIAAHVKIPKGTLITYQINGKVVTIRDERLEFSLYQTNFEQNFKKLTDKETHWRKQILGIGIVSEIAVSALILIIVLLLLGNENNLANSTLLNLTVTFVTGIISTFLLLKCHLCATKKNFAIIVIVYLIFVALAMVAAVFNKTMAAAWFSALYSTTIGIFLGVVSNRLSKPI